MAIFNTVPPLQAGAGIKFDGETISTVAAPRNLLDNSDFTNPVNQRGVTSETDILRYAYFIDRWLNASDTTTKYGLSNQGVTIGSAGIRQYIEGIETGTVLTAAVKYGGKIICVTGTIEYNGVFYKNIANYSDGTAKVWIITQNGNASIMISCETSDSSITVEWAAIYEGEYTAETLPEYNPKGYGAELAECQRYYLKDCARFTSGVAYSNSSNASVFVPTPTRLRACQVEMGNNEILLTKDGSYKITGITADASSVFGNGVRLRVTVEGTFAISTPCTLANQIVNLIADL